MKLFRWSVEAEPDKPWSGNMVLECGGDGPRLNYPHSSYSSCSMRWVSRAKDAQGEPLTVRVPVEHKRVYPASGAFIAAGRRYTALEQLYTEHDQYKTWCRDCYGREVLYLAERFPCFDSSDFETEDRFYRWFFLRQNDKLTRVHFTDTTGKIFVTEDVKYLEHNIWSLMGYFGYFK